jgi:hypothetical protein
MDRSGLVAAICLGILPSALSAEDAAVLVKPQRGSLWVTPIEHPDCASERTLARGEKLLLTGSGFAPSEPVRIMLLHGDAEAVIATTSANASGAIQVSVAVPMEASTDDSSRMRATAEHGDGGQGLVLESPKLRIFADAGDGDTDGVPDMCDNCVELANADLADADDDGLGDACDACPTDPENDTDGDGLCADVDPDPFEATPVAP